MSICVLPVRPAPRIHGKKSQWAFFLHEACLRCGSSYAYEIATRLG